jgi:hypothetical protein
MAKATIEVVCPACNQSRSVRTSDWQTRTTDLCKPCMCRARAGVNGVPGAPSGKGTRLYNIWRDLRQRCGLFRGGKKTDLERYRDRGITVCQEWATAFEPFRVWAEANGYADHLYLDREDNDGPYCATNCRWVTVPESNRNRSCVRLTHDDVLSIRAALRNAKRGTAAALARKYGVDPATISLVKHGVNWEDV